MLALYEQSPLGLSAASIVVDSLFLVHEQLTLICNTTATLCDATYTLSNTL